MYEELVEQVMTRGSIRERAVAETAIRSTAESLGRRLRDVDARAVADRLPREVAQMLVAASRHGHEPLSTDVDPSHTRVVCRLLAELLDEQGRTQLRIQPLSRLFV